MSETEPGQPGKNRGDHVGLVGRDSLRIPAVAPLDLSEYRPHAEQVRVCTSCAVGLHGECRAPGAVPEGIDGYLYIRCCCPDRVLAGGSSTPEPSESGPAGRVVDPADMKDPVSTGRKQAVRIAPIFEGMTCEWSGLAAAGGGVVPIVGCDGNTIRPGGKAGAEGDTGDLHHGPDKNTLNNTPGINLHRICKSCHHTWHALNDPHYETPRPAGNVQWLPTVPYVAHDPHTRASAEDLAAANKRRNSINKKALERDPDVDLV